MRFADEITVMIITYDEGANISRTLDALGWADDILVIDSGSTDATLAIVKNYGNARVLTREFDTFAGQCNFGLSNVRRPWVLSLDADYELSSLLSLEINSLAPADEIQGYSAHFVYRILGRPLSATLYPDRTVLYRRAGAFYRDKGHGHRVVIDGTISRLRAPIFHDDRKPLARWLRSQISYARREADHLLGSERHKLGIVGRIRLMGWPAPLLILAYTLIWKRCLIDGWAGWFYTLQRSLAETLIALELIDRRLHAQSSPGEAASSDAISARKSSSAL